MLARVWLLVSLFSGLLLAASPAVAAGPITVLSAGRGLQLMADPCGGMPPMSCPQQDSKSSSALGVWNDSLSNFGLTAAQNSTIGTSAFSGSGSVSTQPGFPAWGYSTLSVTFRADTAASYSFSGTRLGLSTCGNCDDVWLHDDTSNTYVYFPAFGGSQTGAFSKSGTLVAGHQYSITLGGQTISGTAQSWNFSFTATGASGVPILGSERGAILLAALFGSAVLAALARRRGVL